MNCINIYLISFKWKNLRVCTFILTGSQESSHFFSYAEMTWICAFLKQCFFWKKFFYILINWSGMIWNKLLHSSYWIYTWFSCLSFLSTGISGIQHHAKLQMFLRSLIFSDFPKGKRNNFTKILPTVSIHYDCLLK